MRSYPLLLLLVLFLTACGNDDVADPEVTLLGDWELVTARNNGQETGVIRELEFGFDDGGTFRTNLMGNAVPGTYELAGESVVTAGVKLPLTYSIEALTDSTLHLRTEVRGAQFDFEMKRKES